VNERSGPPEPLRPRSLNVLQADDTARARLDRCVVALMTMVLEVDAQARALAADGDVERLDAALEITGQIIGRHLVDAWSRDVLREAA
jgi:hypothetical protein